MPEMAGKTPARGKNQGFGAARSKECSLKAFVVFINHA
jgi:hypothetical protein